MKLTTADNAKLRKVHPDLVKVIRRCAAITTIPFKVMETARSVEQQRKNIAKGVSWTMRSRHIVSANGLCHAADLVPLVDGKISWSWPVYHKFAPIMKRAANDVGVRVGWGGDWKKTKDGPHWELPWDQYPGTTKPTEEEQPDEVAMPHGDHEGEPEGDPGATEVSSVNKIADGIVRGDTVLWNVQRRLKALNYSPGGLDGIWGRMSSGAIAGFINDRGLTIAAPTSFEMFQSVQNELKAEIAVAEGENYTAPISPERANATAASLAPKVEVVRETIWSRLVAKVQAIGAAIVAFFVAIGNWFRDNEVVQPIIEVLSNVPRWAWIGSALVLTVTLSGLIWKSQRKAEASVMTLHHEGKLQA